MKYPVLALLAMLMVPASLFVGLWVGSPILAVGLPFVMLVIAVILAFVAEDKASKEF